MWPIVWECPWQLFTPSLVKAVKDISRVFYSLSLIFLSVQDCFFVKLLSLKSTKLGCSPAQSPKDRFHEKLIAV